MNDYSKMLTYRQAAQWYGVTERHLKQLRADGKITAYERPGRKTRYFHPAELDTVLGKPTPDELIDNLLAHLPRRYRNALRDLIKKIDLGAPVDFDPVDYEEPPTVDELLAANNAEHQRTLDLLNDLPTSDAIDLLADLPAPDIDLDGYD
ncbi:hypothetical protein HMPREF3048_09680 [Corynebacterium sp. HMSC075D04]|uniref:helix-turn-helix domain-containing protein n=1 Tax=Corynebacterium sp. HMSC075D04 TaxID=1739540 RepID=UPI0008A2D2B9|nr:helix-turn-helix domain-containing protein [Corynebacterium sp. HMSC075D04]OFO33876.1 hypothetical protein HMPREF3048_09680 [Corynebacterium sp. HMSC075D04]